MVVFDGLRDIDDVEMGVVVEDVVFGKVGVDKLTFLIHLSNRKEEFLVEVEVGGRRDLGFCVLESR